MNGQDSAPNREAFGLDELPIHLVEANGFNPRTSFDEAALAELAESIKQHGILEPLVVRVNTDKADDNARFYYHLIAGERRLRAAKLAGLATVPVRVVDVDDRTAHELALVENLVREDLDPIETAEGYRRLAELGVKQAEIGRRVGRSQPLVANTMRLLQLPADVQERIRKGELSTAHGVSLARFSQFPAVASELGKLAVSHKATSKELEDGVPWSWELERAGAVLTTNGRHTFVETTCKKCPFGAYRNSVYGGGICLKPEHFRELVTAELAEANAKAKAELAAAREAAGQAPIADDESVVNADKMPYDSVEELSDYRGPHGKAPPGCKLAECPSYTRGIRYNRATILCLDPKCFKRLSIAQTKAENKTRKLSIQQRAKALAAATRPLTEIGPREAAIVAAYALSQADRDSIAPALKARGIPESAHAKPYNALEMQRAKLFDEYAKLDPHTLLLAVVEALVQGEASRDLDNKSVYGEANLHAGEWYVSDSPPTTAIAEASEPDVEMVKL